MKEWLPSAKANATPSLAKQDWILIPLSKRMATCSRGFMPMVTCLLLSMANVLMLGNAGLEPPWKVEPLPYLTNYKYLGLIRYHTINFVQDVTENVVDHNHFRELHGTRLPFLHDDVQLPYAIDALHSRPPRSGTPASIMARRTACRGMKGMC